MVEKGSRLSEIIDDIITPLEERHVEQEKSRIDELMDKAQDEFDAKVEERREAFEKNGRRDGEFDEGVFVEPDIEAKEFDDQDRQRISNCVENYIAFKRSSRRDADKAQRFAEQIELMEDHKDALEELI